MAADPYPLNALNALSGDPVVAEASRRWNRVAEWESKARENFIDDLKFSHGDSDNGYQWPNAIRRNRDLGSKPCLTVNMIRQHNNMIVNEAKRNKSDVKVVGMGNGATQESANMMKAIMRHIGYHSGAQAARTTAREFQVDGGIGWWRIVTDWVPETFDQEIYIRPVPDPLSVFIDPDCVQKDKSDAAWAFVFDVVPRDQFDEAYPQYRGLGSVAPLGVGTSDGDWVAKDHIRVVEYFRKVSKEDKLVSFMHGGQRKTIRQSRLHKSMLEVLDDPLTRVRTVQDEEVEWYLIAGEQVIDQTLWLGRYIPLICCIGTETMIDRQLDRKGHTRAMKDPQRMYNYNASAQVEFGALQGKTPWIAAVKAIEEYESLWNTANVENHSVMIWNHVDDEGTPIPPPVRTEPPVAAPVYEAGMATASNQMMMASGQWQNQMGMLGNERTGRAIAERQEQSDTAVFHFQDNYALAMVLEGKQLLDLIPKVYTSKQIKRIMADDGTEMEIEIDPGARQAYLEELGHQGEVVKRVLNPTLGLYDVAAEVGPAYGTRRSESVEMMTLILTQNPGLTGIIGDLLLKDMDFDAAQEAARRLKRMVPPVALGQGPTQQEQELQQKLQVLQAGLAKSLEAHGRDRLKLVGKDQMRDIDAYKAETDRMKALGAALGLDQGGVEEIVHGLVSEAMQTHLTPILAANRDGLGEQSEDGPAEPRLPDSAPPVPGARRAPDGEWYVLDPTRRGKYLRVAPLAQERPVPGVV